MKNKTFKFLRHVGQNKKMMTPHKTMKVELNFHIILMAIPVANRKVIGSIDFKKDIPSIISRAREISAACAVSTFVTIAPATIVTINGRIDDYENATGNRQPKYRAMYDAIAEDLLAVFQKAAYNDILNREAILVSGKFKVHVSTGGTTDEFHVENDVESGKLLFFAPGGGTKTHFHEWQISYDAEKFNFLRASSARTSSISGLTPKIDVWITHQLFIEDVGQGVSQMFHIVVE